MAFAWYMTGLLCGQCHFAMHCEVSKNDIPVEFRAECRNPNCDNFGKLFKAEPHSAIQLTEITDRVLSEVIP
jgi:hypothetical protein